MAGTRIIEQWFKGFMGRPGTAYEKKLEARLEELERIQGEWYQALRFGNVPGAYMMLQWRGRVPPIVGINDALVIPPTGTAGRGAFEMRPIFIGAATDGDMTFNLLVEPDGIEILAQDAAVGFLSDNTRSAFALEKILSLPGAVAPSISLDIRTIDTTGVLSVSMIVKNVSQVEP